MTTCERFSKFAVIAMLMIVLLAAPVSSSAAATVSHFVANGPFTDAFFSCNANGVCAQLAVFSGGSAIFYALFLPDGSSFQGFGTIPSENVTHIDSQTLTLAPTDASTIDPALFTNLFYDVNFNCTASPGGIVSGTWTRTKLSSSHSVLVRGGTAVLRLRVTPFSYRAVIQHFPNRTEQ
jgi:hypothetical protein